MDIWLQLELAERGEHCGKRTPITPNYIML